MKIIEVIQKLSKYQKWRRGADIKQPEPKEIGEVIDKAIEYLIDYGAEKLVNMKGNKNQSQVNRDIEDEKEAR